MRDEGQEARFAHASRPHLTTPWPPQPEYSTYVTSPKQRYQQLSRPSVNTGVTIVRSVVHELKRLFIGSILAIWSSSMFIYTISYLFSTTYPPKPNFTSKLLALRYLERPVIDSIRAIWSSILYIRLVAVTHICHKLLYPRMNLALESLVLHAMK